MFLPVIAALLLMFPALLRSQNPDKSAILLDSAKVTASYSAESRGNFFIYSPKQSLNTVSIIGEPDVIRHISSLPGVSQGMEGTLGLFVRGANNGSNQVEFNGVPMNCSSHLLGMFSVFTPETIATSSFMPGGIGAGHGDVSSSLIEIKTKKSSALPSEKSVSISPYMTGVYGAFPAGHGKAGIQAAVRFTPILPIAGLLLKATADDGNAHSGLNGNVYDACILADWNISETNALDFMAFATNDALSVFDDNSKSSLKWDNLAFKVGWDSRLSDDLELYTKIYYVSSGSSENQIFYNGGGQTTSDISFQSRKSDFSIQSELGWKCSETISFSGGLIGSAKRFSPLVRKTVVSAGGKQTSGERYSMNMLAAFGEVAVKLPRLNASFGLRNTLAGYAGKMRHNFDVRAKADYALTDRSGVEMTFDKLTQYHHVLEGLPTGWDLDITIPAVGDHPEEVTRQGYAGIFHHRRIGGSDLHVTFGGYVRKMDNLVSYTAPTNVFKLSESTWEDEVCNGTGKSVGAELSAACTSDRFSGTLAYTLSKSTRRYSEINSGREFPFKFDRRHILNLQGKFIISRRKTRKGKSREHSLNANLTYSSGNRATVYASSYSGIVLPYWDQRSGSVSFPDEVEILNYNRYEMTDKNGWKMKDYFRIDCAYTIETQRSGRISSWSFSVFNVLNRHNAYMVFNDKGQWKQVSIMPIMPSVRWCLKF